MKELLLSENFFEIFIHIILYVIISMAIYYVIKLILTRTLALKLKASRVNAKRQKTIHTLIINILKYFIIFVVIVLILKEFGINTTSLLASLGIVGLVVGLAMQDTLKDFVSGVFIITDRQYEVGDSVTIDNFTGEVIAMGLKTTKIKAVTGEVKIITNSNVGSVINHSQYNSIVFLDIDVAYEEKSDKIIKTLEKLSSKIEKLPEVKNNVKVLGIQELDSSSVKYRISIETYPYKYFSVRRETLKIIKDEFEKENIDIPYQVIEVRNGKII